MEDPEQKSHAMCFLGLAPSKDGTASFFISTPLCFQDHSFYLLQLSPAWHKTPTNVKISAFQHSAAQNLDYGDSFHGSALRISHHGDNSLYSSQHVHPNRIFLSCAPGCSTVPMLTALPTVRRQHPSAHYSWIETAFLHLMHF